MTLVDIINYLLQGIVMFMFVFIISFVIWMAIDSGKQNKFWWIMLITGVPFIGAVIYYFVEHEHEYAKLKVPAKKRKSKTVLE